MLKLFYDSKQPGNSELIDWVNRYIPHSQAVEVFDVSKIEDSRMVKNLEIDRFPTLVTFIEGGVRRKTFGVQPILTYFKGWFGHELKQ